MTNWNWGGYTPSVDSPVIGGFAIATTNADNSIVTSSCSSSVGAFGSTNVNCTQVKAFATSINAFGLIAYEGVPLNTTWVNSSYVEFGNNIGWATTPSTMIPTCPANTAPILVKLPYIRSDGVVFNPYLYNYGNYPKIGAGQYVANATLCVKSDTY